MNGLVPAWSGAGEALEVLAGLGLTFLLHATVLLLVVWGLERLGWLREPAWAEWAWRFALFGAFVSVAIEAMPQRAMEQDTPLRTAAATVVQPLPATPAGQSDLLPAAAAAAAAMPGAAASEAMPPSEPLDVPANVRPSARPLALRVPDPLLTGLLVMWALGSTVLLVRVLHQARGVLRLRRRLLREGRAADPVLSESLDVLARDMRVPVPVLRILPGLAGPLVLAGVILLPGWAEGLDPRQRRAMLAHELAHLRRRDPLWRPLQRLACVPLFFHPLAWTAMRRLEALAETLCDRAAAERSGGGRPLAECLAECLARSAADSHARSPARQRDAGWALAMAEHDAGIVSRVKDLLENPQMTLSTIPARWRWTAAGVALFALIALPGVMVIARPGALPDVFGKQALSVTIRRDGDTYTVRSDLPEDGERFQLLMD